jgi:colicin import membrane protein
MNASTHMEFAPPPTGGRGRSMSFALFMHMLLLAALTWGVQWKTQPNTLSASAELWSAVPVEAAPAANEPEPTPPQPVPPPEPVKAVEPKPEPKPTPPAPPKVDAAAEREAADIALKKEKEKKLQEKKEAALEKKKKLEKEKLEKEKLDKEKAKEKVKELDKKKETAAAKAKDDAKKLAEEEKRAKERHEEIVKNMMKGLPGASGTENSKASSLKSSGPSANYSARIKKILINNTTFTDRISTNPETRVLVVTNSEGLILSRKITQSSGIKAWDEAVLRAIDKTVRLPKDENGRMPDELFDIGFRPNDI